MLLQHERLEARTGGKLSPDRHTATSRAFGDQV